MRNGRRSARPDGEPDGDADLPAPGKRTLTLGIPALRSHAGVSGASRPDPSSAARDVRFSDSGARGLLAQNADDPFALHLVGAGEVGQSRAPTFGQSFLDPTRDADQDGHADLIVTPPGGASARRSSGPSRRGRQLAAAADAAIDDVRLIGSTLLLAYAAARDALDPKGLEALAADLLDKYQGAIELRDQLRPMVDEADPGHAAWGVVPATDEIEADRIALAPRWRALEAALTSVEAQLATEIGPARFQGRDVAAGVAPVRIARHGRLTVPRLLQEAINTGELVAAVVDVRDRITLAESSVPIDPVTSRAIADRLSSLSTRPVHFAFVKTALESLGLWAQVERAVGSDGRSLVEVDGAAAAQAARFGAGVDLDGYAPDQILGLLKPKNTGPDETTYTITGSSAAQVIAAICALADPAARGAALRDLEEHGVLDSIAGLAPPAHVARLHDSLPPGFGHVQSLLRPHFEGRDTSDNSLGSLLDSVPLVGGALESVTNVATFGFLREHDAAYRAMRAGEITEADYHQAVNKALIRAGIVGAVSYATGGAAGAYAEGLTASLAARGVVGRVVAGTVTGGAGGSAGAVGARIGSDLVDGKVSGADDYAHDALTGAAIGGGIGGGLATVGAAGARFLPESVKTPLHRLAERFPSIADDAQVFGAFQKLGRQHSEGVVSFAIGSRRLLQLAADGVVALTTDATRAVRQFAADTRALGTAAGAKVAQLADDLGDGFGPQLAGAGAYVDVPLSVTAQAAQPLHLPGPLDGPAVVVLKAERLVDGVADWPRIAVPRRGPSPHLSGGDELAASSPPGDLAAAPAETSAPSRLDDANQGTAVPGQADGAPRPQRTLPYRPLSAREEAALAAKVEARTITPDEWRRLKFHRRFKNRRARGVDRFWAEERRRLRAGEPETRNWTPEQRADILAKRTPKHDGDPIEGHHMHNAADYPDLADDGANIYPATRDEHLHRWHGGNFQNDTAGGPLALDYPEEF